MRSHHRSPELLRALSLFERARAAELGARRWWGRRGVIDAARYLALFVHALSSLDAHDLRAVELHATLRRP